MKTVINKSSIIFSLIAFLFYSSAYSQDLSTDEKVLQELNKTSKNKIEKRSVCIVRPETLKGIIIIGFFAHDRGCRFDSAFVNGKRFMFANDATKAALKHFGFSKLKNEERANLSLNWTKNALLQFSRPLEKPTKDFNLPDTKEFQTPQSKTNEDGSVRVTLWVQRPAGMQPITYYDFMEYNFSTDGSLQEIKTIDSFNRRIRGQ